MTSPLPGIRALHQVALKSSDLDRSRRFYEELLGMKCLARFDPPGLLFFDAGGTRLLFDANAQQGAVYLRVDDIRASRDELTKRGVRFESDVHTIFSDDQGLFGPAGEDEKMVFFKDPDGNLLALAARTAPT